jgi:hypothetical protein
LNSDLYKGRNARLYRDEREDGVHIVCHCPTLACKRYGTLGCVFLIPKALENMRVNILKSFAANTSLGLIP